MKVVSTNISEPKTIIWNNKEVQTGIYKFPTVSITLGKTDVNKDSVIDREHHGGEHKACYIFGANHYPFFQKLYPNLDWKFGMFGENITIDNIEETNIRIGDILKIGEALVQVSEPRQPCFKLGVRFENQKVLKDFLDSSYSGFYVRVLKEGEVKPDDKVEIVEKNPNDLSIEDVFSLLTYNKDNVLLKQQAKEEPLLSEKYRMSIK